MDDWLRLITAILGLLSAVVVYKKIKLKRIEMGDEFRTLKSTANIVGTIALIMIIFFGFILSFPAVVRIFGLLISDANKNITEETRIEMIVDDDIANNRIAFNAIQKITSNSRRDEQFLILLKKALTQEDNNLVVNIITNIISNTVRTNAI